MQSRSQQSERIRVAAFFAVLLAVGICVSYSYLPMALSGSSEEAVTISYRRITNAEELQSVMNNGRTVLFVNCHWNGEVMAFGRPFREFAAWCRNNSDYVPASVIVDPDAEGEVWDMLQGLWRTEKLHPGTMRHMGGAGRVVWCDDGQVLDYAWCFEIRDADELRSRSQNVFN